MANFKDCAIQAPEALVLWGRGKLVQPGFQALKDWAEKHPHLRRVNTRKASHASFATKRLGLQPTTGFLLRAVILNTKVSQIPTKLSYLSAEKDILVAFPSEKLGIVSSALEKMTGSSKTHSHPIGDPSILIEVLKKRRGECEKINEYLPAEKDREGLYAVRFLTPSTSSFDVVETFYKTVTELEHAQAEQLIG
jgi:hypothetical protein